jgi:IS1 family transposase
MPGSPTTTWWAFPPKTREVQLDEKWSFVAEKQANCDPDDPADDHHGDWWDHVAYDAEHRLVLAVVPGSRSIESAEEIIREVHDRTAGASDVLLTSDEYPAYATAIAHVYGVAEGPRPAGTPGRPPLLPAAHVPADLTYATVHKERSRGRVVSIVTALVLGRWGAVAGALDRSTASRAINTSFVERHHLTDRHRNARKSRKTYRFSKDWRMHEAMTYLTMYSYNLCWPVRTLREPIGEGRYRQRTPAMAAGLADHVWSLEEWLTRPAFQRY